MSLPLITATVNGSRRRRAPSMASYHTNTSWDGANPSEPIPEAHFAISNTPPASSLSQKEPTRSFYYSSFRGSPAPIDSEQNARDVREDTAELASYALTERASSISDYATSPGDPRSMSQIDSLFQTNEDVMSTLSGRREDPIPELSEPASPDSNRSSCSIGKSAITVGMEALKRQSRSTSPHHTITRPSSSGSVSALDEPRERRERRERNTPQSLVITRADWQDDTHEWARLPKVGQKVLTRASAISGGQDANESTPLLGKSAGEDRQPSWITGEPDLESQVVRRHSWPKLRDSISQTSHKATGVLRVVFNPKSWSREAVVEKGVTPFFGNLPAVFLAVVLNILDALSYGLILFPLGDSIFDGLGPAGISMFYVSCIVSQLVFSLGGSAFKGGIGSEMIEVVPFFHSMAYSILAQVGKENQKAVLATTITAYAISSVMTGLVFLLMGYFRFGYVVGFIPRHILTGCIGGVGVFLILTGFEVSARLDGNLNYNLATLHKMFQSNTLPLWLIPLALGIFVSWSQHIVTKHYQYYLSTSIIAIAAVFWFFVLSLDGLDQRGLQKSGWVFEGPESGEPWWFFYTLYDFNLVHWDALVKSIPAMAALAFFGILHVPINVPALGMAIGEDSLNIDRELIAHGLSNGLSGLCGSIQNYLVYTNSVIFIRAGGNSRLAGIMVAIGTGIMLILGPVVIGYIPVMMVGTLIFVLGIDLLVESVVESWQKLRWLEFLTVMAIILTMGFYDFVLGIFLGFALAFFSLVVQSSRVRAIRSQFSGEVANSTVRRNPVHTRYLHEAGKQTHIVKLSGYLFFGTIVSVEESLRKLIDDEEFSKRPIRYLVLDLTHVSGIDFSAAEAFLRINRLFGAKGVNLIIAGLNTSSALGLALRKSGLGEEEGDVAFFDNLNLALESCENEYLKLFYKVRPALTRNPPSDYLDVPKPSAGGCRYPQSPSIDTQFGTPRRKFLHQVAKDLGYDENERTGPARYQVFGQPLKLILQTFHGLTNKTEDFWWRAVPYFVRKECAQGEILFSRGEPAKGFYLLEDGILHLDYDTPQGLLHESIVAGTTCGELPFFSETDRTATCQAERQCITWLLDREKWTELQEKEPEIAKELLGIGLKLTKERMDAITSHVMTMSR